MHVLQWIAIQSEEPSEVVDIDEAKLNALQYVEGNLEGMLNPEGSSGSWFDWFVAGGGRWNVGSGEDHTEAYKEGKTNLVIHAGTDPVAFKERIDICMQDRRHEFDRFAEDVNPDILAKVISSYNPNYNNTYEYSMDLYPIKKVIDMAYGEWDCNSYFYDMTNYSVSPKYLLQAIDKEPNSWYLIPVDFHF